MFSFYNFNQNIKTRNVTTDIIWFFMTLVNYNTLTKNRTNAPRKTEQLPKRTAVVSIIQPCAILLKFPKAK